MYFPGPKIKVYVWKDNENYRALFKYPGKNTIVHLNEHYQKDIEINQRINNWSHCDVIVGLPPKDSQ